MLTRAPRCETIRPAAAWTGTPPTQSPPTSQEPPGKPSWRASLLAVGTARRDKLEHRRAGGDHATRFLRERELPFWTPVLIAVLVVGAAPERVFCALPGPRGYSGQDRAPSRC